MKKIVPVCLLCLWYLSSSAQSNPSIDVQHYIYDVILSDQSDTVKGKATIDLLFAADASQVSIDLANIKSGKGMQVSSVTAEGQAINYKHAGDKILMELAGKKGDRKAITISYAGIPADGLIISKNKYGKRTFFSDNWPNRAHNWMPCVDDPADKATVEFIVTAPSHYRVVSNGLLKDTAILAGNMTKTHWKETAPLPTKIMVIGVAEFAVKELGLVGTVPVSAWVFAENAESGFSNYAPAVTLLPFYENYIAPYPYKKLANVQSKTIFGGMENANTIFYYEGSAVTKHNEESLVAHEIVHQWFGNTATEKHFAHLWLSEGFATYLTHIFIESKYGKDSLQLEMQKDRKAVIEFVKESDRPVVDSVSPLMALLNANSYQKGGWVLHMLRHKLGDTVFHQVIRTYYNRFKEKNAITDDFKKVAEEISGKNLDQFFTQWLYTGGIPKLDIRWSYLEKEKKISVTVSQLQAAGPFQFPLDIRVGEPGKKFQTMTLSITRSTETFTLPVKVGSPSMQLQADPLTNLLFEGVVSKGK